MSGGRFPRGRIATGAASLGLAVCLVILLFEPHDSLGNPLTVLLGVCAIVASFSVVDIEQTLFTDASFVAYLLAAAYLGPAAAIALALVTELATWGARRYRKEAAIVNAFATAAPNGLAAWAISMVDPAPGVAFLGALAVAGTLALGLNAVLVVVLIGMLDEKPIKMSLRAWPSLVAPFGLNMLLALSAAQAYRDIGLGATAVVLALVWVFNYLVVQIFLAREQARHIGELAESRRLLVQDLLDAEDRERRRLSEALHDGPIQQLVVARQDLADASTADRGLHRHVDALVSSTVEQLRAIIFDLYPRALATRGLGSALQGLVRQEARRRGLVIDLTIRSEAAEAYAQLLFSVARELLRNVTKHAEARVVSLVLVDRAANVELRVADDGRGFRPDQALAHGGARFGLASIADRVESFGGKFEIESAPGRGTTAIVALPASHGLSGKRGGPAPETAAGRARESAHVSKDD